MVGLVLQASMTPLQGTSSSLALPTEPISICPETPKGPWLLLAGERSLRSCVASLRLIE
ncbi:hypothetical protein BJY01DRAFT_209724 [Aspergillus pseudoustus]|uniref:Uncharacterized protein n=1 Tax=Aspergillus pseudoustus TaxID=1810923 RepID=A0ABR4KEF9_9EURO